MVKRFLNCLVKNRWNHWRKVLAVSCRPIMGLVALMNCFQRSRIKGFVLKSMLRADFKLIFWDISGQRALRPYWRNYFLRIDALIYVVDCVDRRRIIEAGEELMQILEEEKLEKVPLLVFANKQDSVFALPANELAITMGLFTFLNRSWHMQACSAMTREGLHEGMEWLMYQLKIVT
ncbi:hypothetical protein O6H91_20G055500 [Diphasiastrum complanatum]|uniref:Uncharacterized protein n=1 Tax=Diphasiastrum complanatum TaxID=34168 RepID=A0ACC2ARZ5_DIPCM|nr:hypothetical protein O6H91_20G055500 [Diphasiastrum complanatum]